MEKKFLLGNLKYVKNGDASIPHSADNRVILFLGDISGELETDLAKKLIKRWDKTRAEFRGWYRGQQNFKLGQILTITVQTDTTLLCLLALNKGELDLAALKTAMISAGKFANQNKFNIHINKDNINWETIEPILYEYFVKLGVNVTVYESQ